MADPNAHDETLQQLGKWREDVEYVLDGISKAIDDVLWYQRVGDIAIYDKVIVIGPPPPPSFPDRLLTSPQEKKNHVKIPVYTFVPRDLDPGRKYPLLVFPHGGIHSNFNIQHLHVVRELLSQGYMIAAPEYRGSTGYGAKFYKMIDYGGLEIEDTLAARNWMVENCDLVDADRVGILGWSHGGFHALMGVFRYPEAYKVAYACVPVSDLVARMAYRGSITSRMAYGGQNYTELYSADYHIGKTVHEDVEEYKRRSPAWNADKLQTPLLIHSTTSDEDVNVLEVEHLVQSLKAAGKDFEYKIYDNAPGGHTFNRVFDTDFARQSRKELYDFLAKYLNPPGYA